MDRRIKYRLVLDTEACPINAQEQKVSGKNMLVYDIGWAVVDKSGRVYETRSYLIHDIFCKKKDKMQSAYYANKIPQYWNDVKAGTRELRRFYTVRKELLATLEKYGITEVYAHNAKFDYDALNTTMKEITGYYNFLPKSYVYCDTMRMARCVITPMKTYKWFCETHGYLTARGQVRVTAEVLYRFLTQDTDFVENHTALEDVLIEKEIMRACFAKHKKMERRLFPSQAL